MKLLLTNLRHVLVFTALLLVFWASRSEISAQELVNVSVRVTSVSHNHQCCTDAAGISCGFLPNRPEPRYRIRGRVIYNTNPGTYSATTVINPGDGVNCGSIAQNRTVFSLNGVCADQIQMEVDMWEEDGCGSDNTFDNTCTNDDESRTFTTPVFNLTTPGVSTQTISGANGYSVTIEITWSRVATPTVSGTLSACTGSTATLNASASQTVTGGVFSWYSASTGGTPIFVGNPYTPTVTGNTTYYVAYGNGTCETSRTAVSVTEIVANPPTTTAGSACPGETATLTASAAGALDFNWYADPGMTTLLGTGATFTTPPLAGTTTYYATAVYTTCESPIASAVATQLVPPSPPVASSLAFCENENVILAAAGGGGTLNWYSNAAGTSFIGSGSTLNIGTLAAGTYTYYVGEDDGTCESALTPVGVTIYNLPGLPTANDVNVCPGATASLFASEATAVNFNWYTSPAATIPVSTGSIFTTTAVTAPVSYYVAAINSDGCEGPREQVDINLFSAPAPTTAGTTTICSGETTTLTANAATATGYNWYQNSDKTGFLQNGASLTTLPLNFTTTYYVAATYANGCESLLTPITVTVNQLPPSPVANGGNYCENQDVIVTAFGTGGTINWYDAATGGTLLFSGSSYNAGTLAAGNYVFYAEEDDGSCQSQRTSVLAVVNPAPAAPAVNSPTICEGEQATLIATPTTGTIEWYADAGMTNLLATGSSYTTTILSATTDYYVVEVSNTGCRSMASTATVTVNPAPAAPTVSGASICANSSTILIATNSGGTTNWYADAATSILVGTGTTFTTPALVQNTTYYVQETSALGCNSAIATATVTVNPLPAVPSTSPVIVCEGEDAILTATGSGSGDLVFYDNTQTEIGRTTMSLAVPNASLNLGTLTAGNYVYYVGEDDGACVSILATVGVTVNTTPTAPTATGTTICAGASATLNASGTGIQWYADAALTTILAVGNNFNVGPLTASTDYYVTQTSANGCQSAATMVAVTVNPNPVDPTVTGATICSGESATLTATSGGGTISWYADPAGTSLITTGTTYNTPNLQQTTSYFIQEEDANACTSGVIPVTVIVNPLPNAPSASNPVVCEGEDAILTATGSGSGDLVFYDNTQTEIGRTTMSAAAPNASLNLGALAAGNYVYYVGEDDGTCVSSLTTISVTVNTVPAAPTTTTDTICADEVATLIATGAGTIGWYADAALSSQLGLGNVFTTAVLNTNTSYWVASTDANGCISLAAQVDVEVNPAAAAPTAMNDTVCAGNAATLTATGSGGTLNWYTDAAGMNQIATGATLNIPTISQSTTYYVAETNGNGCVSMTTAVQVVVNPAPTAPAAPAIDACDGDVVTLSATGSGTGDIVFYDNAGTEIGRGTMSAGNNTITFSVGTLAAGTYNYFAAEEQAAGCSSAQVAINVNVQAAPAAPTAFNDSPVCEGEDVFLQATTVAGGIYNWTGPNGFSSTNQDNMLNAVTAADAGTYSVSVMVNGCSSAASTTDVVVNAKPVVGTLTNNGPLCEGETLIISATTQAGVNYNWTGPNGYTANQASASIANVTEVDHQGFYTLTIEDQANGCISDPVSTLVVINKLPDPGMAFSNSPLCVGEDLQLSVPEVFGASYSWTGPNGFTSADRTPVVPNIDATAAGVYNVEVTIDSCTTLLEVDVVVDTLPNTSVIPDTTVLQGDEIVLYATGGITYQWGPADYLTGVATPTPVFANAPVGTYTYGVDITAANGCTAQEKVTVTVETRTDIIITDLFTPNGDGVNDTWVIEFLENVEPYTLQVFSRGGLEVYRSDNYMSDWDGTQMNSGKNLPDGTYYYIIRTQFREYTGAVTIKR